MLEIEKSAGAYVARCGELLLKFEYSTDRWRHELAIRRNGGWQALLSSKEGAADDALPPSPAFQDLRLEPISDEISEFQLFGQAGKGIYSAAVRFDGYSGTITFDVAARANRAGAEIHDGSHYEVPPAVSFSPTGDGGTFALQGDQVGVRLTSRCQLLYAPSDPPLVLIRQHEADKSGVFQTVQNARWQYQFGLAPLP